eukprot:CAMPEP_0171343982 /NCGR_PEP_ID=MMETSP0878-20121228/18377_1 /TAXON_ID=67004 /ORGANISM="Thalassiosira weissflogii, Strain CCMP1336" /LENGTH=48 /DNA_ID= /DNA_START= /DNA_END= /DNA_ORIENTATION=
MTPSSATASAATVPTVVGIPPRAMPTGGIAYVASVVLDVARGGSTADG